MVARPSSWAPLGVPARLISGGGGISLQGRWPVGDRRWCGEA